MPDLFFYGTLCHVPLLSAVLEDDNAWDRVMPAELAGHRVSWVAGEAYPMIEASDGHVAQGVVLPEVSEADEARLSYYEGAFAYRLLPVTVQTGQGPREAFCYFPEYADPARRGAPWSLEDWARIWGEMAVAAARDVMARRQHYSAEQAARLRPFLMARAWSRKLAADAPPATLRYKPRTEDDIRILERKPGFKGFFELAEFSFDHVRYDGGRSPVITREAFVAYDAALALPYDPVTDRVHLIEQLRFGPIWRHDPRPWVLEPIAGLVDAGEDPADTVRREAMEEAGLDLSALVPMTRVYASPGYSSEFFHCFLGIADLSGECGALGGLDSEHEDIRSHVLSFEAAMALVDSGEINAGPLVMMLYWLAAHREELRRAA